MFVYFNILGKIFVVYVDFFYGIYVFFVDEGDYIFFFKFKGVIFDFVYMEFRAL